MNDFKTLELRCTLQRLKKRCCIFVVCLLLVYFTMKIENCYAPVSPIVEISNSLEKWVNYFYINKNLQSLNVKKDMIIYSMMAKGKWESNNVPDKITKEPKINSFSYGIYCVVSSTAKYTRRWDGKHISELLEIDKNTECAVAYYCDKLIKYNGDYDKATCAYNAGKYRIKKNGRPRNCYYYDNIMRIRNAIIKYYD